MQTIGLYIFIGCTEDTGVVYEYHPAEEEVVISYAQATESLDLSIAYLANIRLSELFQTYQSLVDGQTGVCPGLFDAVQGMTGWSNNCRTNDGWNFQGRSQLVYVENQEYQGEYYEQVGSFISNATISKEDVVLDMQGYGDLQVQDTHQWMNMFGWFAYQDQTQASSMWLSSGASISFWKEHNVDTGILLLNGGISQWDALPEDIAGLHIENLAIDTATCTVLSGGIVLHHVYGQRLLLGNIASCQGCDTADFARMDGVESKEICWDLQPFVDSVDRW